MHPCFHILEILQVIASSFDAETDASDLLHMALTCRAFFEPFMDALWWTLRDPQHLINVLPEHTRGAEMQGDSLLFKIVDPLTEAEWNRFAAYAHRVRALHCPMSKGNAVDVIAGGGSTPFWGTVLHYYPGGPLFPNLRWFNSHWSGRYNNHQLLVRPPLRHLIMYYVHPANIEAIIDAVTHCASTLETVVIESDVSDVVSDGLSRKLARAIASLQKPVLIDVNIAAPHITGHLATVPTVRDLRLLDITIPSSKTAVLPFIALERLRFTVRSRTEQFLLPFLRALEAPALKDLEIAHYVPIPFVVDGGPPDRFALAIFNAVSRYQHSLRIFMLSGPYLSRTEPQGFAATVIAPLLLLHALEILEIRNLPIVLEPADCMAMARAWPHLRCLRLADRAYRSVERRPGALLEIDAILPLLRACTDLDTLALPLRIAHATCPASSFPPPSGLKTLGVVEVSPAFSDEAVRLFLDVLPHAQVKDFVSQGTILDRLKQRRGFVPSNLG